MSAMTLSSASRSEWTGAVARLVVVPPAADPRRAPPPSRPQSADQQDGEHDRQVPDCGARSLAEGLSARRLADGHSRWRSASTANGTATKIASAVTASQAHSAAAARGAACRRRSPRRSAARRTSCAGIPGRSPPRRRPEEQARHALRLGGPERRQERGNGQQRREDGQRRRPFAIGCSERVKHCGQALIQCVREVLRAISSRPRSRTEFYNCSGVTGTLSRSRHHSREGSKGVGCASLGDRAGSMRPDALSFFFDP